MVIATVQGDERLVSTGQAAAMLGASRQHVVDLCDRGVLPCVTVGTHRRVRAGDVSLLQAGGAASTGLTRDQLRSLWLHHAVAGKLVADPDRTLRIARRNALSRRRAHNAESVAVRPASTHPHRPLFRAASP